MQLTSVLLLRLLRPVWHGVLLLLVFLCTYNLRSYTDFIPLIHLPVPQLDLVETSTYALMSSLLFVAIGLLTGLYELSNPKAHYHARFTQSRFIRWISTTFLAYFGYGFLFPIGVSRFVLITTALISFVVLSLFDLVRNRLIRLMQYQLPTRVLVVQGQGVVLEDMMRVMSESRGYHYTTAGHSEDMALLHEHDMVVVVGDLERGLLQKLLDTTRLAGKGLYHTGIGVFLDDVVVRQQRIGEFAMLEYKPSQLDGRMLVFKRLFDIACAGVALVVLSPVFLVIAIMIRLETRGPIIYRQSRVGQRGELFTFYKFRSMRLEWCVGDEYG